MPDSSARAMSAASSSTGSDPESSGGRAQEVRVAVRGARDLPQPEAVAVGLAGREVRERAEHVGLALHDHHRDAPVVADAVAAREARAAPRARRRVRCVARVPAFDRRARAGAALQQEPVEHGRERVDRVDVGREVERRLRRARPRCTRSTRRPYRSGSVARSACPICVNMSNEYASPGWMQRPVALGRRLAQPEAGHHAAAFDADELRAHPTHV